MQKINFVDPSPCDVVAEQLFADSRRIRALGARSRDGHESRSAQCLCACMQKSLEKPFVPITETVWAAYYTV